MVKLHLELEGEVVRVLRRIGGGDNADGEVRDGPRPSLAEERTAAVDTVPEPEATSATLVPGHWTQELAADFTAGLDDAARRVMFQVWRAGERGIHRNTLCQRTDLVPVELRSLLIRMGHVLGRFQRERGMVSRVNYICRLASISFAGSPPWPGRVAGQRWCGSWGRQTPG